MSTSSINTSNSSLSSSFYMGKYYSPNREAKTNSNRKDIANNLLVSYDAKALNKFAKDVSKLSFQESSSNSEDNLKGKVKAFVSIYNNYTSSTSSSKSSETNSRASKLHTLTKKQKEALEDIGITINADNTLSLSEDMLDKVKEEDLKKLFSNSSDYMKQLKKLTSKMDIAI